jgi:hypothetical protein
MYPSLLTITPEPVLAACPREPKGSKSQKRPLKGLSYCTVLTVLIKTTAGVDTAEACSKPNGVASFTEIALDPGIALTSPATVNPAEGGFNQLALYNQAPKYPNVMDNNKREDPKSSDCLTVNLMFLLKSKMLPK